MFKNSKNHYESKVNKTDSVIYFNANIYNDPLQNPQVAKLARFNQSISSGAIIDLPENYYMAITRFAISHMLIPLFEFKQNFYSVTIQNGPNPPQRAFLQYNDALSINPGSYAAYGYTDPIFYYSQIVNMVNAALLNAHNASGIVGIAPPQLIYDENTEKFSLYVDENYGLIISISFNANLYQLFQFMPFIFNQYNEPDGQDYTLRYNDNINANVSNYFANITTGVNYFIVPQERTALYLINEVQSIVFTSTTLNVTKEFVGKNDGSSNAGSLSILADFVPDQSTGRDLSEYQYNAAGQPRLVNLTNTIPITDIDYQVSIRFKNGKIVPLYLEPGEVCEVKFGFFKKSLYDNNFIY